MAPRTREELLAMNVMDPSLPKAIEEFGTPDLEGAVDFFSVRAKRADHLAKLRHLYPIPGPIPHEVSERLERIPTRDGAEITVKIYSPVKRVVEGGGPLIVMYHEGGWSMGDLTDEDLDCRMFARDLGAICVNVEYRLAPEYKFPIPVYDCWDALKWAVSNSANLKANPKRGLIVGGGSAGGNLAAVISLIARDEKFSPPITGQYLCVPALLPPDVVPEEWKPEYLSRDLNQDDPILRLSSDEIKQILTEIYQPDHHSHLYAPFNHPDGHAGLPPAFFQLCGMDPVRDEGLMYERKLREEYGIPTRLNVYPGFGHYFWANFPELEMSGKFRKDTLEGVKWLLEQGKE